LLEAEVVNGLPPDQLDPLQFNDLMDTEFAVAAFEQAKTILLEFGSGIS